MPKRSKIATIAPFAALTLAFSCAVELGLEGRALAQAPESTRVESGFVERRDSRESRIVFDDDPMSADVGDSFTPRIVVRPSGARVGLIQLRTHFVVEMLKSVENM